MYKWMILLFMCAQGMWQDEALKVAYVIFITIYRKDGMKLFYLCRRCLLVFN